MCGRFSLYTPPVRVARFFQATLGDDVDPGRRPSWNVAPTTTVLGVRAQGQAGRVVSPFRWGLVPSWSKDRSVGNRLFNARAETVAAKPSFRSAFKSRRLLVPADGFYEWHKGPTAAEPGLAAGARTPYYFSRADGQLAALAGLYESWRDPSRPDDAVLHTLTIVTTQAGADMAGVHERMPVIVEAGTAAVWLDPAADADELAALLAPSPVGTLVHRQVGASVGNVRNNDPSLIDEVTEATR